MGTKAKLVVVLSLVVLAYVLLSGDKQPVEVE
ncbi:hypothetical protein SAMN06264867_106212 [Halorubrum cibi]|jgi:hypothetical protein|uniref:Uncharacterized protein n=1 Tax=Halorubrum cibi TaxID=413815 RepID=A0A521DFX2_9EURY|nr:hypothetical protein SAMN06264867_106212 [Halorubrum cibi]